MTAGLNRVKMLVGTTGTGSLSSLSSASAGFRTLAEAGAVDGTQYEYVLEEGNDFEIGIGTVGSSGSTFSRDTVHASKIGGTPGTSKMSLGGTATLTITYRYEDFVDLATSKGLAMSLLFG